MCQVYIINVIKTHATCIDDTRIEDVRCHILITLTEYFYSALHKQAALISYTVSDSSDCWLTVFLRPYY